MSIAPEAMTPLREKVLRRIRSRPEHAVSEKISPPRSKPAVKRPGCGRIIDSIDSTSAVGLIGRVWSCPGIPAPQRQSASRIGRSAAPCGVRS